MKNDKIIPGVVLVVIGAAILLANYGYLHFHWWNIFRLWPIFLVIAGVNLVFAHNKSPLASIIKITVVVVCLGLLFFGNFGARYNFWPGNHFSFSSDDKDDDDDNNNNMDDDDDDSNSKGAIKMNGTGVFNEPYKADIKIARLNLSGGASVYNLSDTTNQLFNADTHNDSNARYNFSHHMDDSVYVLDFHMKDHDSFNFDSDKDKAEIRLNPNPEWDININAGATQLDFDLSKFKIRNVKLSGAAGSFDLKLGAPLALTKVDVSNIASGVNISIPQNAACSIDTDSVLSGNQIDGFDKTDGDHYETPGFKTAKNKIQIHVSGVASGFNVSRY